MSHCESYSIEYLFSLLSIGIVGLGGLFGAVFLSSCAAWGTYRVLASTRGQASYLVGILAVACLSSYLAWACIQAFKNAQAALQ